MAKNGQQRNYMQVFIPKGNGSRYSSEQALMYGLDKRGDADNMTMKSCLNIDVKSLPNIEASSAPYPANNETSDEEVLGFYAYGTNCYIVKGTDEKIKLYRYSEKENGALIEDTYAVVEWENVADESTKNKSKREMAVFCFYDIPIGQTPYTVDPEYYLLIYPDQKYVKVDFAGGTYSKEGEYTDSGEVKVIAPVVEYDEFVAKTHELTFSGLKDYILKVGMTLEDDGTVGLKASKDINSAFEGCNVKVVFDAEGDTEYSSVGTLAIDGDVSFGSTDNSKEGILLQSVSGNTATFKLVVKNRGEPINSNFYVTDYSGTGDIIFSEDIKTTLGSEEINKTIAVPNLSPNKKYYAFFDLNLTDATKTARFELYFTLADKVTPGKLNIDGKLLNDKGELLKLNIEKAYNISYTITDGADKSYVANENGGLTIQLGRDETADSRSPRFQHITVWNSRLFGTKDNVVVCSCAGTPFDWTADSPESYLDEYDLKINGYDETHTWYSTTQANTKASGDVTAITSFDGHPVIFKDDFMHEVYNTKNPFRIQDICAVGCVSARSVCELDSVLYFASRDGIYRYSGGYPKRISDALGDFICGADTVCGAFDGVLYVYNPDYDEDFKHIYSYNPETGLWAAVENCFEGVDDGKVKKVNVFGFASGSNYLYLVSEFGQLGYFPKVGSTTSESWNLETNVNLFGTSNDKRVHSLMIVHDGNSPLVEINGEKVNTASGEGTNKTRVLLRGFDSESVKLKISGKGYTKIHRIDLVYSVSGRRYKK